MAGGVTLAFRVSMQLFKLWLFMLVLGFHDSNAQEPIHLGVGEQKSFPIERGARFSVGNGEVIQAKIAQLSEGRSLLLVKGKAQGYSDLIVLSGDAKQYSFSFRVVTKLQQAVARAGEGMFEGSGVKMEVQSTGWLLRGKAKKLDDWNAAFVLEEQGNGKIRNLTEIHPLQRLLAVQKIRKRLSQAGILGVEVLGAGNTVLLRGELNNLQEKELAEKIAGDIFRGVRSHLIVPFEFSKGLRFHAKILELLTSEARQFGIDWSNSIPGVLEMGKNLTKGSFRFEAILKMLERQGKAKVLSQPQIALNEKGVAELRVGGEIALPVKGRSLSYIQWKPYGLNLRLEVPGASKQKARAKILIEVSGLDSSTAIDGIPGVRMSRMETTADLEIGKPVLLSGLMESRKSENSNGLAFLSNIPVLGELFQSKDFQENRSELVIWLEAKNQ